MPTDAQLRKAARAQAEVRVFRAGEQEAEADSAAAVVHKLLLELKSERDRLALARFYLDEDSKERICADLKLTEPQFNLILFRARDRLRELLERRGFGRRDLLGVALL